MNNFATNNFEVLMDMIDVLSAPNTTKFFLQ